MDQQSIFHSLQDQSPEAWLAYLQPFEHAGSNPDVSADVILQHVGGRAKDEQSLAWAEVAIRALELEARNNHDGFSDLEMLRAMNLRAYLIARMGSRPDHFVLDQAIILGWVKEILTLPVETATEKAAWFRKHREAEGAPKDRKQLFDTARELLRIKHRLGVVRVLADAGKLAGDTSLDEWLRLREQLP